MTKCSKMQISMPPSEAIKIAEEIIRWANDEYEEFDNAEDFINSLK